jgi:polar amino acid transport system substrate-binding protein
VIAAGRWSGRYDICICSMTPSKARAEVFDFPVEYYASPAVIVVNAKDDRIHGAKDLSGKKVGLTSASSYESYLNKNLVIEGAEDTRLEYPFEDVQIAPYDTDNVAFQDLGLGAGVRLDAILTNLVTAQPRLNQDSASNWPARRCTRSRTRWPSKRATPSGTPKCARCSRN